MMRIFRFLLSKFWGRYDKSLPKCTLNKKHVEHTIVLPDRKELLKRMPKNAVVAEIGVDCGDFSEKILKLNSPRKLHLIDCWNSKRYHEGLYQLIQKKFKNQIARDTVEINRGFSTMVVHNFPNEYFDWIYIDTSHSYKLTKTELYEFSKKVKNGGIIAGHDFIIGNWNRMVRYGVIDAVYEFCVKNDWEIIYLTADYKEMPSFAIRKIGSVSTNPISTGAA